MSRFLGGFFLASLVWGGVLYAQVSGWLGRSRTPPAAESSSSAEPAQEPRTQSRKHKTRTARRRRPRHGVATSGDDLGGPQVRRLDAAERGGEGQLRQGEVEAGIDRAFPQIRRCLMLAASEAPATGRLVFGMRIAGSGRVTKVNLRGPAGVTRGEAGTCMRRAARDIRYRVFDGPDMVIHYPITLE